MRTIALLLFVLWPRPASAIPAFAREYQVPCQTCHVVVTRRNEFGDVFRKAGYHWPEAERDRAARKDPPVDLEGVALFSAFLPAKLPLALVSTMAGAYVTDPDADPAFTFATPSVSLLLGGAIGAHVGFFGTWSFQGPPNELYLHVSRLFDRPELNFVLGRFEQNTTLFKQNEAIVSRYLLSSGSLNGHAVSTGRMGIEYNGIFFDRTFIAGGAVLNGSIGSRVDFYYHIQQKIGGMTLLGQEPDIDLEDPSWWEDIVLTVGHWGYRGVVEGADGEPVSLIRRFGLDMQLRFWSFNLWAGAMYGLDGDLTALRPIRNLTWFVEASYEIISWLALAYVYQYQDSARFEREIQLHDAAILFLPFENLRFRLKFAFSDDKENNEVVEAQVLFGL